MPITSTQKPIAFIRDLSDHLSKRFPASASGLNTITQYFDANGMPGIVISHGGVVTTGNPVVVLKISQIPMVSPDVFGNTNGLAYTPLQLQMAWELGAAGNETWVAHSDLMTVHFEATKTGIQQFLFEAVNGTGASDATFAVSADQIVALDELYWPLKNP
jgi:hypothetical protein